MKIEELQEKFLNKLKLLKSNGDIKLYGWIPENKIIRIYIVRNNIVLFQVESFISEDHKYNLKIPFLVCSNKLEIKNII